ncbi:MAG: 23S rRNA (pseudouridine(1915)-N(3))-methyltransferase RlmH [Oscillospiraceae bacterium]|nr:23S rRNA (pseudouridine(1915)-N(3))-methyltransferase RlmH [Oscillospiraceae bacterium]
MVKIKIINVGTNKESYFKEGINEYIKRLSPFASVEMISLPETKLPFSPSDAEIKAGLEKEADFVLKNIPPSSFVFALCIEGKELSSEEFSILLQNKMSSYSSFTFIIGGSFGLSEEIKRKADNKLSFSKMTMPHTLAKLFLAEQLYRAFSIMNGGKYHK